MHLRRLVTRGFRNLAELDCELPPRGMALLGANAQGKTNLLEAIYYPVLFRSFRGAPDQQVMRQGLGFQVEVQLEGGPAGTIEVTYTGRKKRIAVDGDEVSRLTDAVGTWLAVAFLPADLALASGTAAERRQFLDRTLSLADRSYLIALARYRAALAQRNSALRQGRVEVAQAFAGAMIEPGAELVRKRLEWVASASEQFARELDCLAEPGPSRLSYRGRPELGEVESWAPAFDAALADDRARGLTTVGPQRDDLALEVGGRSLRDYGSTGQHRSAAIALKLIELATLRQARGMEPALLLDDVFAELDQERQSRLAIRLMDSVARQVFVTSPRLDELPGSLDLPVWEVNGGRVSS